MSGFFPYVIVINGKTMGKLYGQALAVAANSLNVPIPTTEHFMRLHFTNIAPSTAAIKWVWALLHQCAVATLDPTQIQDALTVMRQLGIPLLSPLGRTWLNAFTSSIPDFDVISPNFLMMLPALFPMVYFNREFIRKYRSFAPDFPIIYKEITTSEDLVNASRPRKIERTADGTVIVRIDPLPPGMRDNIFVTLNGFVMNTFVRIDIRLGVWSVSFLDPSIMIMWHFLRDNATGTWINDAREPTKIHIYDHTKPVILPPIVQPDIKTRARELLYVLSHGAPYLMPVIVGIDRQRMFGGLWMLEKVGGLFRTVAEAKEAVPHVLPGDKLVPEIWNTWSVLNGSLLVTSNNVVPAWHYASYFGISLDSPYVLRALTLIIEMILANPKAPSNPRIFDVASALINIPEDKRREIGLFNDVDGSSPAERLIYLATGMIQPPLTYPYVDYKVVAVDALPREVISEALPPVLTLGPGKLFIMTYGPIAAAKTGIFPIYDEVIRLSGPGSSDNSYVFFTKNFTLFRLEGKWAIMFKDNNKFTYTTESSHRAYEPILLSTM